MRKFVYRDDDGEIIEEASHPFYVQKFYLKKFLNENNKSLEPFSLERKCKKELIKSVTSLETKRNH